MSLPLLCNATVKPDVAALGTPDWWLDLSLTTWGIDAVPLDVVRVRVVDASTHDHQDQSPLYPFGIRPVGLDTPLKFEVRSLFLSWPQARQGLPAYVLVDARQGQAVKRWTFEVVPDARKVRRVRWYTFSITRLFHPFPFWHIRRSLRDPKGVHEGNESKMASTRSMGQSIMGT